MAKGEVWLPYDWWLLGTCTPVPHILVGTFQGLETNNKVLSKFLGRQIFFIFGRGEAGPPHFDGRGPWFPHWHCVPWAHDVSWVVWTGIVRMLGMIPWNLLQNHTQVFQAFMDSQMDDFVSMKTLRMVGFKYLEMSINGIMFEISQCIPQI